jgi:hypothetical protein
MNPPTYETLELSIEEQVATVCLNRPDKANSMNAAMWEELQQCFEWLDAEPSVRAVILAGNGKHFCAGLDLAMFGGLQGSSEEPARRAEHLRRTILRLQDNLSAIEKCRVPVLAAIHSTCIGGGVDMTCCADMRYATEDAYFSIREIDIGMTADVGTLQRLPRILPDGVIRELAYARGDEHRPQHSEKITAGRARQQGDDSLRPRSFCGGGTQLYRDLELGDDEPGGPDGRHGSPDEQSPGRIRGLERYGARQPAQAPLPETH